MGIKKGITIVAYKYIDTIKNNHNNTSIKIRILFLIALNMY